MLWAYAGHGLDFTDESFYLFWLADPFQYRWNVSQFGFAYHPLYALLDGDIAALRRANMLLCLVPAWAVADRYLRVLGAAEAGGALARACLAAGLATPVLLVFSSWLLTPNYNTLTLQGLLLAVFGLLGLTRAERRGLTADWFWLGTGGAWVFMAKPSSALALAVLTVAYLAFWGGRYWRAACLAALTATGWLLALALLVDGSVTGFIERLREGLAIANLMLEVNAVTHIFRLDWPAFTPFDLTLLQSLAALTALTTLSVAASGRWRLLALAAAVVLMGVALWYGAHAAPVTWRNVRTFTPYAALCGIALGALVAGGILVFPGPRRWLTRGQLAATLLCLALPYAYAFGTFSNYAQVAPKAGFFWILAGASLLGAGAARTAAPRVLVPLALFATLICGVLVAHGMEFPYRQAQPLRLHEHQVEVGAAHSRLWVSEAMADQLRAARAAAIAGGFQPGTPIIDLSGQSPGLVFALQGQAPGAPWLLGGYPGSATYTEAVFGGSSCATLSAAWLLVEVDGKRAIPASVARRFGATFPGSYAEAGRWTVAAGLGGSRAARTQVLFKPVEPAATEARCRALRASLAP